jgi:diketogulonate reductase-like aldo/keto reductase
MINTDLSRRAVLSLGALGVTAAAGCASTEAPGRRPPTPSSTPTPPGSTQELSAAARPVFDLDRRTVRLNDGHAMPILGIGTFRLSSTQAAESVETALRAGYRLIDTARIYGNDDGVGQGISAAGVPRGDIFVTTKLWTDDFGRADDAIDESLSRLGTDYVDLLLLHHTGPEDEEAYSAMEKAVQDGRVRSIGLSNFYEDDVDRIMRMASVRPAVVQNETHPYFQERAVQQHIGRQGSVLEAWFPLGGRGNTQVLFDNPVIADIARAHGRTAPQIILRWHVQAGHIAIPGSSNNDHIRENIAIFDFELTEQQMGRLRGLDRDQRFSSY